MAAHRTDGETIAAEQRQQQLLLQLHDLSRQVQALSDKTVAIAMSAFAISAARVAGAADLADRAVVEKFRPRWSPHFAYYEEFTCVDHLCNKLRELLRRQSQRGRHHAELGELIADIQREADALGLTDAVKRAAAQLRAAVGGDGAIVTDSGFYTSAEDVKADIAAGVSNARARDAALAGVETWFPVYLAVAAQESAAPGGSSADIAVASRPPTGSAPHTVL